MLVAGQSNLQVELEVKQHHPSDFLGKFMLAVMQLQIVLDAVRVVVVYTVAEALAALPTPLDRVEEAVEVVGPVSFSPHFYAMAWVLTTWWTVKNSSLWAVSLTFPEAEFGSRRAAEAFARLAFVLPLSSAPLSFQFAAPLAHTAH